MQPCVDLAVIGFVPVVRVLLCVVARGRGELVAKRRVDPRSLVTATGGGPRRERMSEERPRGRAVTAGRDQDVAHLPELIDRALEVGPATGDLLVKCDVLIAGRRHADVLQPPRLGRLQDCVSNAVWMLLWGKMAEAG